MKKTYINPNISVYVLKVNHQLLAGSQVGVGDPGSANSAEGRAFDFFDEE